MQQRLVGATNIGSANYSALTMCYSRNSKCWRVFSMLQDNSGRYMTFAAPTIISCKYYYILLLWRRTIEISKQDGGLIKEQKNAHHHTPIPST